MANVFFFFRGERAARLVVAGIEVCVVWKKKRSRTQPFLQIIIRSTHIPCAHTRLRTHTLQCSVLAEAVSRLPGVPRYGTGAWSSRTRRCKRASERERKRHVFFHNHALPHPFLKRKKLAPHPSSPTCAGSTPPSWPPPSSPQAGRGPTAPAVWVHPFPRRSFFCSRLPSASRRLPATLPPFTTRPPRARLPGWACWWARPRHRARRWDPSSAAPPW